MTVNDIWKLIESDSKLKVEDSKIREFGIDSAVVYSAIKEKSESSDDFFAYSVNDMEHDTCVNGKKQKHIIDELVAKGYISVKYKDIPKHRYVKVLK